MKTPLDFSAFTDDQLLAEKERLVKLAAELQSMGYKAHQELRRRHKARQRAQRKEEGS